MMEFHISRKARERYRFAESLFSYNGNVVFANVSACRAFAHQMNQVRQAGKYPDQAVHAGALFAMGLIDEASHVLMARYREQFDPEVMTAALDWFAGRVGSPELDTMLLTFVEHFPGQTVMRGQETPRQWLNGKTGSIPHRAAALEELLLLWSANRNEAFKQFEELFEDKPLAERTVYRQVTQELPQYFSTRPLIPIEGATAISLLDLLRAPVSGAPASLAEQLALIRKLWRPLLGDSMDKFLMMAGEVLHEEELAIWMQFNPDAARIRAAAEEAARRRRESGTQQWPSIVSESQVPTFGDPANEYEKFSPDTAWMPNTVLIAKSTYVWLAQLSKQYGRHIHRLDQIPDEELATLAHRGLNSLWLIGVWERSRASKTIKQLCGNQDAVASAYSLFDYKIAEDLGGESAYINLRDRCYHKGIRLASDMVPNHMGIDSPWVIEHPEWFISRPDKPYPAYSFNGPDLSHDGRVEIKIDDHYFEQTDAAVVFQRRDKWTNDTRYIYHGNDGTSFPWNDTAQLDYLNPAVREQVIQTILYVARLFPVIRFDAAMTLAKRHFHRLWFPGPGSSGAIPSRAEYSMSQAEFNQHMPHEFWREVVDRVAAEVPGTLLLAEAFWLMEGYFVRTLGMHRVYNSAFMNMMRDEKNAEYRSVIKNTLEFDPDIMKRYVNFMSNPDERTAIDQFGKGDKCFGVAALMATLPGLPMFGHGQIEGFTEKYGMEYYRPRYDETPDHWLVERHDREIAPLLKRRWVFAESHNFLLYDFFEGSGSVDENIFAYSNRTGNERALIVYNNHYGTAHGTIHNSAAYADKGTSQLRQRTIGDGLGFGGDTGAILAYRDTLTGLEYLRRANEFASRGITLQLSAYQCHVFMDWHEKWASAEKPWDRLCDQLNGRGVPSLDDALVDMELQPLYQSVHALLDQDMIRLLTDLAEHPRATAGTGTVSAALDRKVNRKRSELFNVAWTRCEAFLRVAQPAYRSRSGIQKDMTMPGLLGPAFRERLSAAMRIPVVETLFPKPWTAAARRVLPSPSPQMTATAMWGPIIAWCALETLADSIDAEKPEQVALDLFDRLRLRQPLAESFTRLGFEGETGWRAAARIKVVLLAQSKSGKEVSDAPEFVTPTLEGSEVKPADTPGPIAGDANVLGKTAKFVPIAKVPVAVAAEPIVAGLQRALWTDPDVRWLAGVHEAGGHTYLVCEPYEELLWWLQMPALLAIAGEPAPSKAELQALSEKVHSASAEADNAEYRLDALLAREKPETTSESVTKEPRTALPDKTSEQKSQDGDVPQAKVADDPTTQKDLRGNSKK
ncbi:alpha-amylase family glycosyl hydrolase [Telmatobacter sp. DSM 110680]|uniref:Alpha-amylase family glycosyl hydrolase n=1 Tax=Telmatobacter sp. DSM 110680 TaxID=3036704 RepID=A0AAU7DGX8_9BACT